MGIQGHRRGHPPTPAIPARQPPDPCTDSRYTQSPFLGGIWDRKSSTKGNKNPLKGRDSVRFPGVADSCSYFSEGLSQISGVDGSSGMVVDFALRCGAAHDPECDCRECPLAEAPI